MSSKSEILYNYLCNIEAQLQGNDNVDTNIFNNQDINIKIGLLLNKVLKTYDIELKINLIETIEKILKS